MEVAATLSLLIDRFVIDINQIDYLLLHQANKFLCEKIRKRVKFDATKVPYNIDKFGNTSGASIPLLMVTNLSGQLKTENLNFIATGFGVGLSLGSVRFNTIKIICRVLLFL